MKIISLIQQGIAYVFEAVARIFAPSDDDYPATGTTPFQGEPNQE